jgi:hypothetical protein
VTIFLGHSSFCVNKSFVRIRLYYLYLPMDVCTIFLHIYNKKFWLQFICNKLISTTAHESVKIISTKWFMHISHMISEPLHPAFNGNSKNLCAQLQCISSTLYSLTSINWVVTVRGVADCRNHYKFNIQCTLLTTVLFLELEVKDRREIL